VPGPPNRILREMFDRLIAHYGPQHWWPAETPFEVIVGAILTQNTNWTNVEKAIANLKAARTLEPAALGQLSVERLAELIRPAGYFNIKAARLRHFLDWLLDRFGGNLDTMFACGTDVLREELLAIKGIGPETADSILLYAGGKLSFVVDTYTHRVMTRHQLIDADAGYEELKAFCEDHVPAEVDLYNEFHALLVNVGKDFCRPKPKCSACPLCPLLREPLDTKHDQEDAWL